MSAPLQARRELSLPIGTRRQRRGGVKKKGTKINKWKHSKMVNFSAFSVFFLHSKFDEIFVLSADLCVTIIT